MTINTPAASPSAAPASTGFAAAAALPDVTISPRLRPWITFGLPVLAVAVSAAMAFPRYRALRADEDALARTRAQITAHKQSMSQLQMEPVGPVVARSPATRDEPVTFLRDLNRVAAGCRVRLTRYTPVALPPPAETASGSVTDPGKLNESGSGAAASAGLPAGTSPVALDIMAEGTYASLAMFFARLETYPRLISVDGVTMRSATYPALTANFRLTRYTGSQPDPEQPDGVTAAAAPLASRSDRGQAVPAERRPS